MIDHALIDYADISDEAWNRMEAAANDPNHPMHLCVLATVDGERPDARLMILRGASCATRRIWFHTDLRSAKVDQSRRQPRACVVSYDPRDGVQIRVSGELVPHHEDATSRQHWEQLEISARFAYRQPFAPGSALPTLDPRRRDHMKLVESGEEEAGLENFCVLALEATSLDWMQVGTLGDRRAILRRDTGWRVETIAP